MAGSQFVVILRLILNIGVLCASGAVLYGVVRSTQTIATGISDDGISDDSNSKCLLWGTAAKGTPAKEISANTFTVYTASNATCHFSIIASVVSILLALVMTGTFIYTLCAGSADKRTCLSVLEVILLVSNMMVAISLIVVISGGLLALCSNIRAVDPFKRKCSDVSITGKKDLKNYYLYSDLNVAQVGTWALAGFWFLHLVFSCINCCLYRRGNNQEYEPRLVPGHTDVQEDERLLDA